jgi:PhnB protein
MGKAVNWQQEGYRTVTPYLAIDGAAAAIDFYSKVFGARERMRMPAPGGRIGHAELEIGDAVIMLADNHPELDFLDPRRRGGTSVTLHIYVADCDAVVAASVKAGARVTRPPKDEFYGDRNATIEDPFGHVWHVSTHVEDVSDEEIRRRTENLR